MQVVPRVHSLPPALLQLTRASGFQSAADGHPSAATGTTYCPLQLLLRAQPLATKLSQTVRRRSQGLVDSCVVSHPFPVHVARLRPLQSSRQLCTRRWQSLFDLRLLPAPPPSCPTWVMSMCSFLTTFSGSDVTCVWTLRVSSF